MNQLVIIYELKPENAVKKTNLKGMIRKYGKFAFLNDNACIIWTEETPASVRDNLKTILSAGDRLYVGLTSAPAAWLSSVEQEVTDYIQKNLQP